MALRELNERTDGVITVRFMWEDSAKNDPNLSEFHVLVLDENFNVKFYFLPETFEDAKEAYYHPFAVVNRYLKSGKFSSLTSG